MPMFYVSVLHHDTRIEPKTSLASNLALTTDIPLGTEEGGLLFRFIADTKFKREKIKNLVVKQCNSLQGCTIRLETSIGYSSLRVLNAHKDLSITQKKICNTLQQKKKENVSPH
jgi:hypothetical protein